MPAIMADSAHPFSASDLAVLPAGTVAIARPLFAGATDADGSVAVPIATPLSAAEVATIHGAGLAVLPYANNLGWVDLTDPASVTAKSAAAIHQASSIGVPAGCYVGVDLEDWTTPPAALSAIAAAWRASIYGGAGLPYFGAASPTVQVWRQLRATDPNVGRMILWIASWQGTWTPGMPLPAWNPGVDDPAVEAWQFTDKGAGVYDLSLLRLPMLSVGSVAEGLWLPDGTVGSPNPAKTAIESAVHTLNAAVQEVWG